MKKEKYYYIRDAKHEPVITVCLLEDAYKNIGRGVAICSDDDQSCKRTGRNIARLRARLALHRKCDTLPTIRITKSTAMTNFLGFFKSYFNPVLTKYEQKLLHIHDLLDIHSSSVDKSDQFHVSMAETKRGAEWQVFAEQVLLHIDTYTVPQYGDKGHDDIDNWTISNCFRAIEKYIKRSGTNVRKGQDKLDILKIAHYACFIYNRMESI